MPCRCRAASYDRAMTAEVVALGAWCDVNLPEEERSTPGGFAHAGARLGWLVVPPEEAGASPGGAHFRVHEFAILADGCRVTLRDDLGFSSWSRRYDYDSGKTHALDAWHDMTRESVESGVRNVVLPDGIVAAGLSGLLIPNGLRRYGAILRLGDKLDNVSGSVDPVVHDHEVDLALCVQYFRRFCSSLRSVVLALSPWFTEGVARSRAAGSSLRRREAVSAG